jgi:hypothetical protein
LNEKMKETKGIDMPAQWFWIDIICLDQQHPPKMETIKHSNEIYCTHTPDTTLSLAWCTWPASTDCGAPWSSRANWAIKMALIQTWR